MSTLERMMRQRRSGRRHRPSPWLRPPPRRRRGNVRVYGCCLPIPLGMLTAAGLGARLFLSRRR